MATSKNKKLLNTTQLAKQSGLNRATVNKKLETAGVRPLQEKAREKLYDADEALTALQSEGTSGLRKAQTAKTAAEAARAKLKLDKERGELVSIHDVRSDVQAVVSEIRQHFLARGQALAPQLRGQKVGRIEEILRQDTEQFFNELRAAHEDYLSESQAED